MIEESVEIEMKLNGRERIEGDTAEAIVERMAQMQWPEEKPAGGDSLEYMEAVRDTLKIQGKPDVRTCCAEHFLEPPRRGRYQETPVKALSIRQPWIELILQQKKTLEIRSWKTDHRGEIFIHSAYNLDRVASKRYPMPKPQTSAIVGTVNIDDVEELNERRWRELAGHHLSNWPWDPDRCRYGFLLSGARALALATVSREIVSVGGGVKIVSRPEKTLTIQFREFERPKKAAGCNGRNQKRSHCTTFRSKRSTINCSPF